MASRGEIWLVDFEPGSYGREERYRPALVVSSKSLTETVGLTWVVPISIVGERSRAMGLSVPMMGCKNTTGVALCEQLRAIDLQARDARWLELAPDEITDTVIEKLAIILGI